MRGAQHTVCENRGALAIAADQLRLSKRYESAYESPTHGAVCLLMPGMTSR